MSVQRWGSKAQAICAVSVSVRAVPIQRGRVRRGRHEARRDGRVGVRAIGRAAVLDGPGVALSGDAGAKFPAAPFVAFGLCAGCFSCDNTRLAVCARGDVVRLVTDAKCPAKAAPDTPDDTNDTVNKDEIQTLD